MHLLRHLPRFKEAYSALDLLASREAWPRADIEALQLERLNAVWTHAVAHVPYYRRLAAEAHLPDTFGSLAEFQTTLPVLQKSTVKSQPRAMLSEQPDRGTWKRTGGSTGTPMPVYWSHAAHLEMLRSKYRQLMSWDLDIFDRTAFVWGHSSSFAAGLSGHVAKIRQPLEDRLRRRLRLSAYALGHDDLRGYVRRIARFKPASLYGYPRAIYLLAREAEAAGATFDGLKLIVLSGEPAFPNLVEAIERTFGVPAAVEYGSIDCGQIAHERRDRKIRVREDMVLVETAPRDDGLHDLIVAVLNNPSFPLLRYAIGDTTAAPLERPPHGFAILQSVSGRNNDLIVSRSGRYLHSARFDAFFKYQAHAVRRFRVHQRRDGELSVMLELDDAVDTEALQAQLSDLVGGYPVSLSIVDTIPQTAAGKHRLVVSDLADDAAARAMRAHAV